MFCHQVSIVLSNPWFWTKCFSWHHKFSCFLKNIAYYRQGTLKSCVVRLNVLLLVQIYRSKIAKKELWYLSTLGPEEFSSIILHVHYVDHYQCILYKRVNSVLSIKSIKRNKPCFIAPEINKEELIAYRWRKKEFFLLSSIHTRFDYISNTSSEHMYVFSL